MSRLPSLRQEVIERVRQEAAFHLHAETPVLKRTLQRGGHPQRRHVRHRGVDEGRFQFDETVQRRIDSLDFADALLVTEEIARIENQAAVLVDRRSIHV